MVIATAAGILTNIFDKDEEAVGSDSAKDITVKTDKPLNANFNGAVGAQHPTRTPTFKMTGTTTSETSTPSPTLSFKTEALQSDANQNASLNKRKFSFISAMKYAFITLLGDIAKPLFWGLIIGALITVAIPDNLSEILKTYNWLSYIIVIVIAVPMYVCATASLPIAAGLMLSGVSAGAAFVFLSAGPATNTVTIGVVKKMLGSRSLAIYLGTIIIGSVLFGLGLDFIFDASNIDPTSLIHMDENGGIIATLSSIVLWGLVLYFLLKPYFTKKESCSGGSCCS